MRLLGAILAGGASRRFGHDKAMAMIEGRPMLDHVFDGLAAQCEAVAVVGRDWPGMVRVDDLPLPGLGPLGGLAGALAHADAEGFDAVLTSGCDLPDLPKKLADRLGKPNAVLAGQPTIGLWQATLAPALLSYLEAGGDLSIRSWVATCGARTVPAGDIIANINTSADLAAFIRRQAGPLSSL